jgi:hypothetical protein
MADIRVRVSDDNLLKVRVGQQNTVKVISSLTGSITGIPTYSDFSGISTYSRFSGISTYANFSGISTYSRFSGISTYSNFSGISTYSNFSGISTYSNFSGISTNVIGGIGSINQLTVNGISTFYSNLDVRGLILNAVIDGGTY